MKNTAVVIYVDNEEKFIKEYNFLHYCFVHNNLFDTIDLVVFHHPALSNQIHNDCIKIEFEPLSGKQLSYGFLNSVEIFTLPDAEFISQYSNVLRTDSDVFLTHNFKGWNADNKFYCGRGSYHNSITITNNLTKIAHDLNLRYTPVKNIGSTWYANGNTIIEVGKLTTTINKYLLNNYFQERVFNWPDWTYGVSLLYAGELAINHLCDNITFTEYLDYFSDSTQDIDQHKHIHCWHTNNRFSKFAFNDGLYNTIDPNSLNQNKIDEYCTYIALQSRMSK
jgi:hypothetical protein